MPLHFVYLPYFTAWSQQHFKCLFLCRGKTNFFEKRVGDYQKSGVMAGLTNSNQHAIAFDEDF